MTEDKINGLFEAIDSMDTASFVSYINEDGSLIFGNSPEVIGRANIFETIDGFFKSIKAIKHDVSKSILADEELVVYGTSHYTRHDDSNLSTPFCNVFQLKDGLIQKYQIYIDLSQLYK